VLRVFLSPSIGNVSKKPSILLHQFTIQCGKLEDGQNLAPLLLIALVHQFLYEICYIFSFFGHCEQIKPLNQLSNRQSVVFDGFREELLYILQQIQAAIREILLLGHLDLMSGHVVLVEDVRLPLGILGPVLAG